MRHLISGLSSEVCTLNDRMQRVETLLSNIVSDTTLSIQQCQEKHTETNSDIDSLRAVTQELQDMVKSAQLKDIADALLCVDIFEE
jgi:predicted  nucleic acid-binding Zn-ribbon protein